MSKVVKKATKPFKKVAKAVTKTVSSAFKTVKNTASSVWKEMGRAGDRLIGLVEPKVPNVDIPDQKLPAPPAPDAEQYVGGLSTPENTGRRRKRGGRSALRIDLNTGGGGGGQGVNVPVG